jgi:ABC-2 type transport system permease protein
MMRDIWTVARKELIETWNEGGRWARANKAFSILIFGIFLPWQMGRSWVESPLMPLMWSWVPMIITAQVVTDAFAGERERHTLETLLASRLSDDAILLGKLLAGLLYGLVFILSFMFLGTLTVNIVFAEGELLFYSVEALIGLLVVMILAAGLICGVGVLVSLRARGMKQALQGLMVAIVVAVTPLSLIPLLLPEDIRGAFFRAFLSAEGIDLMVVLGVVLLVVDSLVLLAARARFRRAKMLLD